MNFPFKGKKHVHFIGIGGIGISAIARMCLSNGVEVSGSDSSQSLITEQLVSLGALLYMSHSADNISDTVDLIIYTIAIPESNPELVEAKKRGIELLTYPESLKRVSEHMYTIAVAGTHGKTTTTAMIAKMLDDAGLSPTVIVGSLMKEWNSNYKEGKSEYLVVEACEYKRSFINIHPAIGVITTIDADHLDYYKDLDEIKSAFVDFSHQSKKIVTHMSDTVISTTLQDKHADIVDADSVAGLEVGVPGKHNIQNAQLVATVGKILSIPDNVIRSSLASFKGTWRRFEYKGTCNKALCYDDYGHHPTEIQATLEAVQSHHPGKKIVVCFEPHLYSRTKQHLKEFAHVLSEAEHVYLLPIYPAREPFDASISSDMLADEINKKHKNKKAVVVQGVDELKSRIVKEAEHDCVILTSGAGTIYEVWEKIFR